MTAIARHLQAVEPASVLVLATLILVAFGLKLGLFPFHFWLPPVYVGVRPVVAAILGGVVASVGSFGLLRFGGGMFWRQVGAGADVLFALGLASILYGAAIAASRRNTREVLAYSSVSQAGYILVALAAGGAAGYAAAVLYAVINAGTKTLLFLSQGVRGRGVGVAFAAGALSLMGVPPAVGFFGKAAVFRAGLVQAGTVVVVLLFLGSALSFVYMLRAFQGRYWERPPPERPSRARRRLLLLVLAAVVVGLGLWPQPLLRASSQAAAALMERTP